MAHRSGELEPPPAPQAWQLECLRSRKAGEDLDALAERLAGLPGASAGAWRAGGGSWSLFCAAGQLLVGLRWGSAAERELTWEEMLGAFSETAGLAPAQREATRHADPALSLGPGAHCRRACARRQPASTSLPA